MKNIFYSLMFCWFFTQGPQETEYNYLDNGDEPPSNLLDDDGSAKT